MASFTVPPPPLEDHPDGLLPARGSQTPSVSFVGPLDPSRSVINRPRAHSSVSTRSRSKSSGAALIRSLLEEGQDGDEGTTNFGRWGAVNGNLSDYEEVRDQGDRQQNTKPAVLNAHGPQKPHP